MQSALSVVTEVSAPDRQYVVVGDGSQELVDSRCGSPVLIEPERDEETIATTLQKFPTINSPLGGMASTKLDSNILHSISSTVIQKDVTADSLSNFFEAATYPVKVENQIFWTDEISIDSI